MRSPKVRPPHHPLRVGRSRTGLGLYAVESIPKGDFIIQYWGKMLTAEKGDELDNKYLFEINSKWTIDGASRRNIARYANHSCRPNAESDVKRDGRVIILAKKNIKPGDEITYDYGENYFEAFIEPLGCLCDKCIEKRAEKRRLARKKSAAKKARTARKSGAATAPKQSAKKLPKAKAKVKKAKAKR
jgi:SET domain-containing protein